MLALLLKYLGLVITNLFWPLRTHLEFDKELIRLYNKIAETLQTVQLSHIALKYWFSGRLLGENNFLIETTDAQRGNHAMNSHANYWLH